ncbi:unnamed protein product [Musa acuminata subsp. burmannicoides]
MEGGKGSSSSSSSPSSSRWNPTKEQISVLEGLYKQGIRTPSAEQIQHITGKLREYGNIEGKNVFYWFQNHKARQRQKQKQESFAYFSRLLQRAPPPVLPPTASSLPPLPTCTDVGCSPYYVPVPQVGGVGYFHPQFPNVIFPAAAKRTDFQKMGMIQGRNQTPSRAGCRNRDESSHETLQLFPLHPTGILERRPGSTPTSASTEIESVEEDEGKEEVGGENQPLFNFFGGANKQC